MTTALQVHNGEPPTTAVALPRQSVGLIRPIAAPAEVLVAQEETRQLVQQALQEGRDFGKIPGVDKPSLLKPGAERVSLAFGCTTRFTIVEKEVDHDRVVEWIKKKKIFENRRFVRDEEQRGTSLGLYRYVVLCELVHRESGQVVGSCLGSCSSMESKYVDRPRDCENTIIKMAEKRAMVGATLTTFGLSEQFTQDVEDMPHVASDAGDTDSAQPGAGEPEAKCPKCSGRMWDNRTSKTNPKSPDFKCRDKKCEGVYWPGQWPPEPLATAEQKARVLELLAVADLAETEGEKVKRIVANTDKPLKAARADQIIAHLEKLGPRTQLTFDEDTPPAGSGEPAEVETTLAPGNVEDALDAPRSAKAVSERIATLLNHAKLDENDRRVFRSKLDKATTLEAQQALADELEKRIDLPF